ncbi:MAG TPA: NAD(P)H-hydrate dehydratase [Candidatus Scatomorpha intestinigallinarum]|uniref:ADP-dependent (S)-NAD(P)H-hydrate dehydratase n=1 Tax=Candidatus Scatomorpha intestinigallinarum TaxID=2840923 RepID=A0A9D1DMP9_9FIRM|nr:NAD(P)H-hydrate dehydratase [Candidatus Scatomorpha intestinigallinarum]
MKTETEKPNSPVRLPKRARESSKRDYGRLLILAGSRGYTGAPSFASRAAVRGGAGLVWLGVPESIYAVTAVKNDEAMPFPLPCDAQGRLTAEALPEVEARLERMSCLAIGPGLGRSAGVTEFVQGALAASRVPTVVDADALWALSRDMSSLEDAACPLVLTPHEGEFAMLGGLLDGDRVASARRFASRWGCTLVLKGSGSVVAFPDGECYVNQTGNPGMARGGSGDVLTGLMAAMLCQLPFRDAVRAAVYLHGLAGDMAAGELGEYGMTPTDMIRLLPAALKTVTEE